MGGTQAPGHGGGFAPGELVFAEHLEELDMAEGAGPGVGQAGV